MPAKGSFSDYQYIDSLVAPGASYWYKLGDVDINGNITWHGPVSATVSRYDKIGIRLEEAIPNLFTHKTAIRTWGLGISRNQKYQISIYDVAGKMVRILPILDPSLRAIPDYRNNLGW